MSTHLISCGFTLVLSHGLIEAALSRWCSFTSIMFTVLLSGSLIEAALTRSTISPRIWKLSAVMRRSLIEAPTTEDRHALP
jgi:hypothetical protein